MIELIPDHCLFIYSVSGLKVRIIFIYSVSGLKVRIIALILPFICSFFLSFQSKFG